MVTRLLESPCDQELRADHRPVLEVDVGGGHPAFLRVKKESATVEDLEISSKI
jgi:hypothetical protein